MSWDSPLAFMLMTGLGVMVALAAVRFALPRTYAISKTVASLGFVGTAVVMGATSAGWSQLALGALLLSTAGDVALTVHSKKGFLTGMLFFALAHGVYTSAFTLYGMERSILVMTALPVVLISGGAWLLFRDRLPGQMRVPVGAYLVVISAMLATGIAAGLTHQAVLLVCGVVLVAGSDIAVARERFGTSMFSNKLIGLPTYYLGQTLIALSLAAS